MCKKFVVKRQSVAYTALFGEAISMPSSTYMRTELFNKLFIQHVPETSLRLGGLLDSTDGALKRAVNQRGGKPLWKPSCCIVITILKYEAPF